MKTAKAIILALSLATVAAAQPALAGTETALGELPPPPPGDGGGRGGPMGPRLLKRLGLSATQKQQIEATKQKYEAKLKDLSQQLFKEHAVLGDLMTAHDSVDKARAQHQKIQTLVDQIADQRFEMMYEISGVLTADQRSQLHTMLANKGERRMRHRHPKRQGGERGPFSSNHGGEPGGQSTP